MKRLEESHQMNFKKIEKTVSVPSNNSHSDWSNKYSVIIPPAILVFLINVGLTSQFKKALAVMARCIFNSKSVLIKWKLWTPPTHAVSTQHPPVLFLHHSFDQRHIHPRDVLIVCFASVHYSFPLKKRSTRQPTNSLFLSFYFFLFISYWAPCDPFNATGMFAQRNAQGLWPTQWPVALPCGSQNSPTSNSTPLECSDPDAGKF